MPGCSGEISVDRHITSLFRLPHMHEFLSVFTIVPVCLVMHYDMQLSSASLCKTAVRNLMDRGLVLSVESSRRAKEHCFRWGGVLISYNEAKISPIVGPLHISGISMG